MRDGIRSGLLIAALLLASITCVFGFPMMAWNVVETAANSKAAVVNAEANLEHERAVARQMDAATNAVIADTRAAHSAGNWLFPLLAGALSGILSARVNVSAVVSALERKASAESCDKDYTITGTCPNCGGNIDEVRPGSWQCPDCTFCCVPF